MSIIRVSARLTAVFFVILLASCAGGGTQPTTSENQTSTPALTEPKPAPRRLPNSTTTLRIPAQGMFWYENSGKLIEIESETAQLEASIGQAFKQMFTFSMKNKTAVMSPGTSAFQSITSSRPVFFTRYNPSNLGIARFTVQPDRNRRYVWVVSRMGSNVGYFYPYEDGVAFDYSKISDDVYKIVLRENLKPGEYGALFSEGTLHNFKITADATIPSTRVATPSSDTDLPDIKWVQKRLTELGYSPGPADGIMGSRTESALRSFQENQNIQVTGTANQKTMEALRDASPDQRRAKPASDQVVVKSSPTATNSTKSSSTGKTISSTEMKSAPDPFEDTIEIISAGNIVEILREDGEWLFVRFNGKEGYVYTEFVTQ